MCIIFPNFNGFFWKILFVYACVKTSALENNLKTKKSLNKDKLQINFLFLNLKKRECQIEMNETKGDSIFSIQQKK